MLEIIGLYELERISKTAESRRLANKYVKAKVVPEKYSSDAIHVAIATLNNIDVLVSWNFSHIVKYETKVKVNKINQENNYSKIEILSPEEV